MVFVLFGCLIGSVLLSVMVGDTFGKPGTCLTFACDLWLEAREIKIPASLNSPIERVKRDAAAAKDKDTLRAVTDQFLAMTKSSPREIAKNMKITRARHTRKKSRRSPDRNA